MFFISFSHFVVVFPCYDRQRGHEPTCKAAVHACVDVAKEIRRQAVDIGIDLDPPPKLDLKASKQAPTVAEQAFLL